MSVILIYADQSIFFVNRNTSWQINLSRSISCMLLADCQQQKGICSSFSAGKLWWFWSLIFKTSIYVDSKGTPPLLNKQAPLFNNSDEDKTTNTETTVCVVVLALKFYFLILLHTAWLEQYIASIMFARNEFLTRCCYSVVTLELE